MGKRVGLKNGGERLRRCDAGAGARASAKIARASGKAARMSGKAGRVSVTRPESMRPKAIAKRMSTTATTNPLVAVETSKTAAAAGGDADDDAGPSAAV